jgi:hypothetical protein
MPAWNNVYCERNTIAAAAWRLAYPSLTLCPLPVPVRLVLLLLLLDVALDQSNLRSREGPGAASG